MGYDRIDSMYDALVSDGAQIGTRQQFKKLMLAPGNEGYRNRLGFYQAMKQDGANIGATYEDFGRALGLHAVKPQHKAKPLAQKPVQPVKKQTMKQRAQEVSAQYQKSRQQKAQQPVDYLHRPQNQMGRQQRKAPTKASPFVQSLYEVDNAQKGPDYSIDYTSPKATQQVYQQNQQVRRQAAQTASDHIANAEYRRQSQPMIDNGTVGVMKPMGEIEQEMSDAADSLVASSGDFIKNSINNEYRQATLNAEKEIRSNDAMGNPFMGSSAGLISTQIANKYESPDKIMASLQNSIKENIANILPQAREQAIRLGVSEDYYINNLVLPKMVEKAVGDFRETEVARRMPKNDLDYFVQEATSSNYLAKLGMMLMKTKSQRQFDEEALARTNEGMNPNYKPSTALRVGSDVVGMASDPIFGASAKAGGFVAGKLIGNSAKLAALMANGNLAQRLMARGAQAVTSGGVTGFVFDSTGAVIQNYSTGEDTSLGNTLKVAAKGGTSGAVNFATMSLAGIPLSEVGRSVGLKAVKGGSFWGNAGRATAKVGLESGKTYMEAMGMYLGGYVSGKLEGRTDANGKPIEFDLWDGTMESLPTAIGFRLQHAVEGLRGGRKNEKGEDMGWFGSTLANFKDFVTSDKAKESRFLMTEDERNMIFSSGAMNGLMPDGENVVSYAKRTKNNKVSYDDPYLETDVAMIKNTYDQIMADPKVSWDAKAKFSAMVTGIMPSARPMMDYITYSSEDYVKDGLLRGKRKYVNEYSAKGELLSKIPYDNKEDRDNVVYNHNIKRENLRLYNAMGLLARQDRNNYELQNDFFVENMKKPGADVNTLVANMGNEGSDVFRDFSLFALNSEKGTVLNTIDSVAVRNGMKSEDLIKAMKKNPMKRTDFEQNVCVELRRALEAKAFPDGKAHAEQSNLNGKDVAEDNNLGTEQPNGDAVKQELNGLRQAEAEVDALLRDNDVFSQNFKKLQNQGLTNPQIYDWMVQQGGLTVEQLEPFAHYINANARVQGMQEATKQKIEETVSAFVQDWSYHGTLNGQPMNGEQALYVQDSNGRTLLVGSGDVAFDQTTGRAKEGSGDMLVCLDPNTKELVYVKADEVTLVQNQPLDQFAAEYRQRLQMKNSEPYNQAAQEQAMQDAAKPQPKEQEAPQDNTTKPENDTTSGENNTTNEDLVPQEQPQPSRKFADGTDVPMATDSKGRPTPDYEKMTPEQSAEILTEDFGDNAEKVVDGQIKKAENALKDAEKMKVDYTAEPNDIMEQEALKNQTIEAAKKQLNHAQNIKKAMTAKKVAETVGNTEQTEGAHEAGSVAAKKFVNAPRLVGNKRTRMLADGETKIRGHYEIVPAESLTPSHDVNNDYKKSEGFPTDAEGRTVNDRDYEHDKAAQQNTDQIARKYNGMAIEQVPVVSDEGIVYDGNGRTMAGQKAAKDGTDGEYINDLLENAENFGFTREQIEQSGIEHPRLVLVTDERLPYDTATFSKFNRNEKKTQSNTEQAVAKAKTLTSDEVGAIVAEIEGNGSLDAFFNNSKAINDLVKTLVDKGIIGQNEVAQMMDSPERLSAQGREYVKNLLLGSIFKPETIRMLGIDSTVKNKAINAIRSVMDNMKLGEFSLRDEIDQAIQLLYEARQGGNKVDTLLRTPDMFGEDAAKRYSSISQMMALALEGKVADFRDLLDEYNRIAASRNTGEGSIFEAAPTKEELINEYLNFKKWQDYGTGHSETEGSHDVSGVEKPQQEASGGNEPTEAGEGRVKSDLDRITETDEEFENERKAIVRNAKENGTFMKAPNGRISNLDKISWITVRTKEFKNWFGDWENDKENSSKIVDENGEPLVVFHGSDYENDSTKEGDWSNNALEYATYFAPYKYADNSFSYAAFLNIRNPFYEHHDFSEEMIQEKDFFEKFVTKKGYDGIIGGETENIRKTKDIFEAREIVAVSPDQVRVISDVDGSTIISRQDFAQRKIKAQEDFEKQNGDEGGLPLLPKEEKPDPTFDPIAAAAKEFKKEHPLTEEEIMKADVDDVVKDMALDYLNGDVTDDLHRAIYESIFAKTREQKAEQKIETPKAEPSADPMEGIKNAAEGFEKEKKAKAETEKKPQQTADDAAVSASNKKVNDLWKELMNAGKDELSASFVGLNSKQLELLPKLVGAMAENAYLRIKRGMHNLEDVVKEMRKEFAPAAKVFKKEDVDAIYEQMMNIRYRDGEQRMSLKEWADYYEKTSPKHQENLVGDSKTAEERKLAEKKFIDTVNIKLGFKHKFNGIVELRKIAERVGLKDIKDTDLQELAETAIVKRARGIASSESTNNAEKFKRIKTLYENQPSLNQRDSERVMKQQYSTPAPYAFLADMYVKGNGKVIESALEPSAGNGMLTIGLPMDKVHVNDIDAQRLANLRRQGFKNVTSQDGTQPFADKDVDVVVTNPPFGSATPKEYDGYKISSLEGQMAINALDSMKGDGRAAIIIGGNTEYAKNGSLNPKDKAFLGYLYSHYNVEDVINVDGGLYAKQGTSYPTRIILINGRRNYDPEHKVFPPVEKDARAETVKDYDELYKRIEDDILRSTEQPMDIRRNEVREGDKPSGRENVSDSTEENGGRGRLGTTTVHDGTPENSEPTELDPSTRPVGQSEDADGRPVEATGNGDSNTDGRGGQTSVPKSGPADGGSGRGRNVPSGGNEPVRNGNGENGREPGVRHGSGHIQQPLENTPKEEKKQSLTTEKVKYQPHSAAYSIGAVVPARQKEALDNVLNKLGDADQYLVDNLGYNDKEDLYAHLAAEQIDAVALGLKQMEKGNGFIIGDQTGIGKGRQAAAIIRYAVKQGRIPISFTQKANLFSDTYRDLNDIGSPELRPFILASSNEGNIKINYDEEVKGLDGQATTVRKQKVVYKVPSKTETERVLKYIAENRKLPEGYDYILTTYSQIRNGMEEWKGGKWKAKKKVTATDLNGQMKRDAIKRIAENSVFILDESHDAAGEGSGSAFIQDVLPKVKGVTFLSATYAKTPDAMKLYALKTDLGSKNKEEGEKGDASWKVLNAIKKGGAVFQEIMSQALTKSGQMIRRERDMTGVTIDWNPLTENEVEIQGQRDKFDNIFGIFNDILNFQRTYVDAKLGQMSDDLAFIQGSVDHTPGTKDMGIGNVTFASKAYNVVQQALFSIKAEKVADYAIEAIKNGEKPVIAVNNTMGSMIDEYPMGVEMDMPDLNSTLMKGLEGILRYTEKNDMGDQVNSTLRVEELGEEAVARYNEIKQKIASVSSGLSISPIDVIKHRLEEAGYKVGELTGRNTEMVYTENGKVIRKNRTDKNKNALADRFNNGDLDALILNRSAAAGISLHASSKYKDQRQRTMIFAQMQGNINDEVQIRGRIDRTGQVRRGKYVYLVSAIPAEQRLMMMFKNKLKSLDANTTSSQKSKFNEVDVQDFTNKYGDEIVLQYMAQHPEYYNKLADPLGWGFMEYARDGLFISELRSGMKPNITSPAYEVMKRLTLLPVKEQEVVLKDISDSYSQKIKQLNDMGMNDLEMTDMPLEAKTLKREVWKEGSDPNGDNAFADNTYIETVEMNVLRKPMKAEEVVNAQKKMLDGKDYETWRKDKVAEIRAAQQAKIEDTKAKMAEQEEKKVAKVEESTRLALEKENAKIQKKIDKGEELKPGEHVLTEEEIKTRVGASVDDVKRRLSKKLSDAIGNVNVKYDMFINPLFAFDPNKTISVPNDWYMEDASTSLYPEFGRVIGFKYDKNYNLGSSTIVIATTDSRKRVEIPLNRPKVFERIQADSERFGKECKVVNMDAWDRMIPKKDRTTGRIITGNMLEALADNSSIGHLISYTTDDGKVKQGILVPDSVSTAEITGNMPIVKAYDWFTKKTSGTELVSTDGTLRLTKNFGSMYTLFVPASRKEGGKYYLNQDLLDLVHGRNFQSKGKNFWATFDAEKLKDVLNVLNGMGVEVKTPYDYTESGTHFRMELGKTFSDTKENFDGVRDRAVEEKGIVMPNLNKESVNVVPVEKHSFKGNNEGAIENARKWAKENLVTTGKSELPTMRDGTPYTISKKAVDKYLSSSAVGKSDDLGVHLSVLPKLTDVIHESIEAEIHPDYNKDENGNRSIENGYGDNILVHRLYGAVRLSGKTYRVKTTMQEFRGGEENKPHSYEVTKIELLEGSKTANESDSLPLSRTTNNSENELLDTPGTAVLSDSSPLDMTPSNSISVAKLLNGVEKSYDSGKKLLEESKNLTEEDTYFRNDNDSPVSISKDAPAVVKHIAKVAKATGGKVKMLQSVEEVTNAEAKARLEKGEKVEGWYDERTGEVVLYMPNVHDRYTAEKTVWHEIVGHKGMRELFGNDNYDKFLDDIYFNLDKPEYTDLKKLVVKELQYNPFDYRNAIEEAIARMAEEGHGEHGLWNNLKNKVTNIFREIGYRVAPNTKDIKYLLWLAKNYSKHPESDGYFAIRRNALLHKLERDNTPSIVERNGMYFDNDGKNHDYLLDLNHKDFEEATDGKVHFRTSPMTASKIEEYNRRLGTKLYAFKESTVDNMQSLQEAMEIISGEKHVWTDIPSAFNPLQAQNRIDSIVQQKAEEYDDKYTKPLDDSFKKVVSTMSGSDKDEQLRNAQIYMITKHGLERNRVFFVRDAIRDMVNDDITKAKTLMKNWNDKQKDLADELEKGNIRFDEYLEQMDEWIRSNVDVNFVAGEHDYSGFHGMQNIAKTSEPYEDKLAIDNVMSAESQMGSDLAKDFWAKKKAATDYVIDQEYYNGFIDNSDRDYLKGMFQWYVPLRKFDDTTAEDVYGYIGEKGDPSNFVGPVLANAKGRSSLSDINVMAQISAMAKSSLINGGKNVVKQHFARFVSAYETGNTKDKIFVEVNPWLEKHVVDGKEVWEEATPQIPENATQQQISDILQNFEDSMQAKKATGDAKLSRRKPNIGFKFQRAKDKSEHIIDVYIAGRKRSFVCQGNPRAAQALNGLLKDSGTRNAVTQFDAKVTRKIAQFNTSLNPDFMMSNMLRDLTFASANVTKEGFAYTKDFLKEYAGNMISIKNGKGSGNYLTMFRKYRDGKLDVNNERERMFKEFMDNGGQTGFVQIKKLENLIEEYDNLIKKGSKDADGWFVKKIKEGGTFIETANEIIENVARYSTYCTSRKHGRSIGRSIYDAKEVSTNFNRHGSGDAIKTLKTSTDSKVDKGFRSTLGFFNSWMKNHTQFYNAGVQGANLFFKNYKSAWKTSAVSFGMLPLGLGIAQALINQFLINNEDEKDRKGVKDPYAELPEWKRRNNICIYTGHGNFKTIPIAIELRAFFGLGDIAAGYAVNDKLKSSTPIGYDILGQMAQLVPASDFLGHHSPSSSIKELGEDAMLAVTPTTISPAMELAFNRDWTGRPFYRDYDYLDKAPRWKRAYDNTNDIYMSINKWANQGTNGIDSSNADMKGNETLDYLTAPYAWEHLIDSYTGGMGSTIGRTYKTLKAVGESVVSGAKNKEGFRKGFSEEFDKFDKNQIPLYRVFNYTPKEGQDTQRTRSKWYNYSNELKQTEYNIKQLKTNTPDVMKNIENNAKKFNFTHGEEGKAYNIWKAADSYISKKKKQLNKVSNPEVIKSINEDINRKMQEAVNDLDKLN